MEHTIGYIPTVLNNIRAIEYTFGVSKATIMKWIEMGAPVSVEGVAGGTRYAAEIGALQEWRVMESQKKRKSCQE